MRRRIAAEQARGLLARATPGVWVDFGDAAPHEGHVVAVTETSVTAICRDPETDDRPADRALIAAAPDLAYTVVELEKERDHLRAFVAMVHRVLEQVAYPNWPAKENP